MRILNSNDLGYAEWSKEEALGGIMPSEPVMIRMGNPESESPRLKEVLLELEAKTDNIIIEGTTMAAVEWSHLGWAPDHATIALRIPLEGATSRYEGFAHEYIGNKAFVDAYHKAKTLIRYKNLAISIELRLDNIDSLGPSIFRLYQDGVRLFFLDIEGKPDPARVKLLSDAFEYLNITGVEGARIYFPFSQYQRSWSLLTRNTFSGLEDVHIDLSNRCTHSCHFCGIYSPDNMVALKEKTGSLPLEVAKFIKLELDFEKAKSTIQNLPWTVRGIQFGGAGDPMMHPRALDILSLARERGICVQVLSNMEYVKIEEIDRIHSLGGKFSEHLRFIINCSGGSEEIYIKTRPKQNREVFRDLKDKLKKISHLRETSGGIGANFTLMYVVTALNFEFINEILDMASEVKALDVWLKPLEIHANWMHKYALTEQQKAKYAASLPAFLKKADDLGVSLMERDVLEAIIFDASKKELKNPTESRRERGPET